MFDIGWTEILIVLGIAIVVVGPKELPKVLRTVGKWRGKASAYARDFQRQIEDAADQTELDAVRKEIADANRELNEAKQKLGDQATDVKNNIEQSGADDGTTAKASSKDGGGVSPDSPSGGETIKPDVNQEKGASA